MKTLSLLTLAYVSLIQASSGLDLTQPLLTIEDSLAHVRIVYGPDDAHSHGSYGIFVYQTAFTETFVTGKVMPRDGEIVNAWITPAPDNSTASLLLIWMRCAGTAASGTINAFLFDGQEITPTCLPTPDPSLLSGHTGHDSYSLTGGILYHSFPLYLPQDPNCCPTGGTRTLMLPIGSPAWTLAPSPLPW